MGKRDKTTGLTDSRRLFVLEYLSNGRNATRAYLAAYPTCDSYGAARTESSKLLTNPDIERAIAEGEAARIKRLQMDGDKAMALIGLAADADVSLAYDETGSVLPVHQWPYELRMAVREVKPDGTIKLLDPLKARELVATAAGRIRNRLDVAHSFDHASFLAALTPASGKP